MFYSLRKNLALRRFNKKWRDRNLDNETAPGNIFDLNSVHVGQGTYGQLNVYNYNRDVTLSIGNFCSIASEVMFILNADHRLDTVSSFPFKAKLLQSDKFEGLSKGNILVGDDVWIGYRATILSGVTIGQGAVIAAGAVVADDVAPYSIVGGVPAKTIKFRFRPEMVQTLLNLDFSKLTTEMVRENISSLYQPLTSAEQIKWFPRKKQNEN